MTTRVLRAFAFGFGIILIGVHLQSKGLTPTVIGLILAVGLCAASLTGLLLAAAVGQFGRRRTLAAIGLLMALSGLDLAFATQTWLFLMAGVTGMMGVAGTDLGPYLAVEQAVLAQTAGAVHRNRAFARYSLTGALASSAGGFVAGAGTDITRTEGFFFLFAVLGLATAVLPLLLSPAVEAEVDQPVFGSFRPLLGLAALFALDSLGGGLVVNAVIVYWLHIRFGATPALLGPSFALMSLVAAGSFELSGRLADRIGLINTMVFTHLPSSISLAFIPLAPGLWWVLGILLVRSAIVSMDQPARQAYIVSIVKPSERSGAIAITGAIRGVALAAGPAVAGAAIQAGAMGIPFTVAAALKSLYDVGLFFGFRRRLGDHEAGGRRP